ncbi:hypothetical protein J6590_016438 [Homalodisca vitripennis]|nr:hypothetical protein J6590_016438 [Homalodisca vitripennis]
MLCVRDVVGEFAGGMTPVRRSSARRSRCEVRSRCAQPPGHAIHAPPGVKLHDRTTSAGHWAETARENWDSVQGFGGGGGCVWFWVGWWWVCKVTWGVNRWWWVCGYLGSKQVKSGSSHELSGISGAHMNRTNRDCP